MKTILFICLIIIFISCKKENKLPLFNLKNQVKANIILTSGDTIKIDAIGSKALMGCSSLGGGTYVSGTKETNAAIYMTIYGNNFYCVDSPGTYNFSCEYRPDITSQTAPIYSNAGVSNAGSITFTSRNGNDAQGYFNAVCKYDTDSVIVQGTFKGYIQ